MIIGGNIHPRAIALILEWAFEHREELLNDWELARKHEALLPIKPLGSFFVYFPIISLISPSKSRSRALSRLF